MSPEQIQNLLNHPILKKLVELGNDKDFMAAMTTVYESQAKKAFWWTQLVFFIAVTVLRWWRQGEAESFGAKLWVSLYCFVLLAGGTGYLIPSYYFGDSYRVLLQRIWGLSVALWS